MIFRSQLAVALASLTMLSSANPLRSHTQVLHEKRTVVPPKWEKKGRVHKDFMLPVRIGLTQNNLDMGHSHLMDVSDPRSPNYGKYWSAEKVHAAFAPSKESINEVRNWLNVSGIAHHRVAHSKNQGWFAFDARSHEVESLLSTEYYEYHHIDGDVRIGNDEYHLPSHIRRHVDYVTPGVKFSAPLKKRSKLKSRQLSSKRVKSANSSNYPAVNGTAQSLVNCDTHITPACIKALYRIPDATSAKSPNSLGMYELSDTYAQEDLDLFYANYAPYIPKGTHPIPAFINGATAPVSQDKAGGESNVDLEIVLSLIYPQTVTLYQTDDSVYFDEMGDRPFYGWFNNFLDALDGSYCTYSAYNLTGNSPGIDLTYPNPLPGGYNGTLMCGVYKPTNVISISYGSAEIDLPVNYQQRQCNEFLKLGLQGHTILVASGDFGVAVNPGDHGKIGCIGDDQNIFSPGMPSCPYVTSVGATRLYDGQTVNDPESVLQANLGPQFELFGSAGGFSNIFPRADYQADAVNSYLSTNKLPFSSYNITAGDSVGARGGVFNIAGRAIPDVSANGCFWDYYLKGVPKQAHGTSLAAPIWAGVVTLINEARYAIGKGPVGFINPVIYQHPEVFNDIKNGSNPGCHAEGFHAVRGWDPVTGLGTPKYPSLEQLYLSLP